MIRRGLVSAALASLTVALVVLVARRALDVKTTLVRDDSAGGADTEPSGERYADPAAGPVLRVPAPGSKSAEKLRLLSRPLSVVGLGWERLAPAIVANGGLEPSKGSAFAPSGLAVSLRVAEQLAPIVDALAEGGASGGADLAIVPLPRWLVMQDRLEAIGPVVLYTAGWSRGREGVLVVSPASEGPKALPEVRVAVTDPDAAYLALFGLHAQGRSMTDVTMVSADADPPPDWQAVDLVAWESEWRGTARPRVRWTTHQAAGGGPIVMVGARSWVRAHQRALVVWLRGWYFGVAEMSGQTAAVARQIAGLEKSPSPLRMMRGIETWEPCSLSENLALFDLDGPFSNPLRVTMERAWRLLHQARMASPMPRVMPLDDRLVRAAWRAGVPLDVGGSTAWSGVSDHADERDGMRVVLERRLPEVDGYALARDLTMLGGAFPNAVLRVVPNEQPEAVVAAVDHARALSSIPQTIIVGDPNPELSSAASVQVLLRP